jgi:hypothetical protein
MVLISQGVVVLELYLHQHVAGTVPILLFLSDWLSLTGSCCDAVFENREQ